MPRLRSYRLGAVALSATAALVLAACGSGGGGAAHKSSGGTGTTTLAGGTGQYGRLPKQSGTPRNGGTVSIAESPGAGPNYIFPITPGSSSSVYVADQFQYYMWRPLWWGPKGDVPEIDLSQSIAAGPPRFSDDNKTIRITLRKNWKWSDGSPVTAADCEFFIDLLKAAVKISPANFGAYTPGLFPDFITSMSAPNPTTLVLHLNKTYNQNFLYLDQLVLITPLPAQAWARDRPGGPLLDWQNPANAKAIYTFLNKEAGELGTYASNPLWQVVDGPYRLKSFDSSNDGNTLVANHSYSGPYKPHIETIDDIAFTSTAAEFNQLLTGALDVGYVDYSDLSQVGRLRQLGYSVWGYPDFGFNFISYNFADKTAHWNNIISQLYIRQAFAHLQDEPAIITSRGDFDGAAGAAYGPVPAIPRSPFAPHNALKNPYPFSVSAARTLLTSHGWKVVRDGLSTCIRPGSGANECGAGIPKGTPLKFNLFYTNQPDVIGNECETFASEAKLVGVDVQLISKTFDFILNAYDDPTTPRNDNDWASEDYGGFTDAYYPTTNEIFNTKGAYNGGLYSDPKANELIEKSVTSLNSNAVRAELQYITEQQPGLFQPNPDQIFAFKNTLSGPPSCFADASQYQFSPECWYFKKT